MVRDEHSFDAARSAGTAIVRIAVSLFVLALMPVIAAAQPRHVYLTWQGNTSRTITVNYQTMNAAEVTEVYFDTDSRGGEPSQYRFRAVGGRHQIEGLEDGRWIHDAKLLRLKPGRTYYFIAGDAENGYSAELKFRTIPRDGSTIRFVTGGDMGVGGLARPLQTLAAQQNPMFGLIGGDLAYGNGRLTSVGRWDGWLDDWEKLMVTPDGHMVPMVLAIGNHETRGGYSRPIDTAPFYFGYFAQHPTRSYFSLKFGDDLIIHMLDSGHAAEHGGRQARWLEAEMQRNWKFRNKFAVYHIPLYPSHRPFLGGSSVAGREHWAPIFDKYGLNTAFENHDHTFKRSKLLRNNQVDPKGTLYLGDGCFGRFPRTVDEEMRWYLEKAGSVAHFWLVEVSRGGAKYTAINAGGDVIDVYPPEVETEKEEE